MYYGIFCFGWFYWLWVVRAIIQSNSKKNRAMRTSHKTPLKSTTNTRENQEIIYKNQANNEDNHERTKERKDCENNNKPASEPRNNNKHNNGCLSVLRKRVLVCPCFLVWVFFLFRIFCIASLWLHLPVTLWRNYLNNQNKRTKEA